MDEPKSSPFARLINNVMRLFFRLLYHPMAWSYDWVAATVSRGRWKRWVFASSELLAGPRVLELGYGPGHLQVELHRRGLQIFGLDESRQMAAQAARRLVQLAYVPCLARGLAQALPFPTASFDSVIATFPTLYIVDPRTLASIRRVLKPRGRLVVLMAAWITGRSLLDRLMALVFRITGESPDENLEIERVLEPYRKAGFKASLRFIEQPGSRLMLIIASNESQVAA